MRIAFACACFSVVGSLAAACGGVASLTHAPRREPDRLRERGRCDDGNVDRNSLLWLRVSADQLHMLKSDSVQRLHSTHCDSLILHVAAVAREIGIRG